MHDFPFKEKKEYEDVLILPKLRKVCIRSSSFLLLKCKCFVGLKILIAKEYAMSGNMLL